MVEQGIGITTWFLVHFSHLLLSNRLLSKSKITILPRIQSILPFHVSCVAVLQSARNMIIITDILIWTNYLLKYVVLVVGRYLIMQCNYCYYFVLIGLNLKMILWKKAQSRSKYLKRSILLQSIRNDEEVSVAATCTSYSRKQWLFDENCFYLGLKAGM